MLEATDIKILFDRVRACSRARASFPSPTVSTKSCISDRVYVMKDGEIVAEIPAEATSVPKLHAMMVGPTSPRNIIARRARSRLWTRPT